MKKYLLSVILLLSLTPVIRSQDIGFKIGYGKTIFGRTATVDQQLYYSRISEINQVIVAEDGSFGEGLNFSLECGVEVGNSGLYITPYLSYLRSNPTNSTLMLKGSSTDYNLKYEFESEMLIAGVFIGRISKFGNTTIGYQAGLQNMVGAHYSTYTHLGDIFDPKSLKIREKYTGSFNPGFTLRFLAMQQFDKAISLGMSLEYRNAGPRIQRSPAG